MSDSDDASVLRQVREAEAAMAERPSPRVRQAVLRAAAEAVGKEVPGAGRRQAPQPAPASGWLPRNWRWSLPVAASVLVGAVAFSLVSQVQRSEGPTVVASAALEEKKPAAPAPAPVQQARSDAEAAPATSGAAANFSKAKESAPMAKAGLPAAEQNAPAGSLAVAPVATEAPAPQPRAEPSGEPLDAGRIEAPKKEEGSLQARQRDQLAAGGRESARLDAASESAPAPAASAPPSAVEQMQAARSAQPLAKAVDFHQTPQQWIDHIVALRRDGRQDEADRELALLRKRYPDVAIPPAARHSPE